MDLEAIAVYRRNLQNYRFYLKEIKRLENELEVLIVRRNGLHGMNLEGVAVQGSKDPYFKFCKEDDLRDKIDETKIEIWVNRNKVNKIENDLSLMNQEIAKAIRKVYIEKTSTIYKEAKKMNMDDSTLKRRINYQIWKIIKKK